MASKHLSQMLQQLRKAVLLHDGAGLTDGQLLDCFVEHRDEAALATLVKRHGPMVWGVCHRLLRNLHDAEDAFQATFLVLVRKAASVKPKEMVGNWLYGVAHQTALKAQQTAAKRRARERQVTEMPEAAVIEHNLWNDLQPLLDHELSRLPNKYRVAIVLCDLEGKTRKEVALRLGLPEGTVGSRLARARTMLAKRLAQHGLALSSGALAAALSQNVGSASVPTSVLSSTIKAATVFAAGQSAGLISVQVAALTEGVMNTMLLNKLKIATAVLALLLVPVAGTGLGLWVGALADKPSEGNQEKTEATAQRQGPERPLAPEPVPEKPSGDWSGVSPTIRTNMGTISQHDFKALLDEDKDGALIVHLAFSPNKFRAAYRPVAGNTHEKLYPLKPIIGGGWGSTQLIRFRLDPKNLPASQAKLWAIEALTPEAWKIRANDAVNRAKKMGVEILPFPEIGSVYEFALTAMDGKLIRSKDLRGRVVLIEWRERWPGHPSLYGQLYQVFMKHPWKDGLEIVTVSFEQDQASAWPVVVVPTEERKKELWEEVMGFNGLPRLLLLDRSGVLRADYCEPFELEDQIDKLLKEPQAPDSQR
jgi:RNA polymerase sigma factor (sigma-70 family)